MKLTIHQIREGYGAFISDVEIIEYLLSGTLKAYYTEDSVEKIVDKSLIEKSWGKEIRKAQLMKFLISPSDSFGSGGYGPSVTIEPGRKFIFLVNMYFKKEEIEGEIIPKKFPVFNYIKKIENNYGVVEVRDVDGNSVEEKYKHPYGLIIKNLVETFIRNEDAWVSLDSFLDDENIKKSQPTIDKLFKNKIITDYIECDKRYIRIRKDKIKTS